MDGRSYTPPAPSADNKLMPRNKSFAAVHRNSEWDDWGDGGSAGGGGGPRSASGMGSVSSHGGGGGGGGHSSGSEYTMSQLQASAADKDNFFNRKIAETANRPEGLPPSQGARGGGQDGGLPQPLRFACAAGGMPDGRCDDVYSWAHCPPMLCCGYMWVCVPRSNAS